MMMGGLCWLDFDFNIAWEGLGWVCFGFCCYRYIKGHDHIAPHVMSRAEWHDPVRNHRQHIPYLLYPKGKRLMKKALGIRYSVQRPIIYPEGDQTSSHRVKRRK